MDELSHWYPDLYPFRSFLKKHHNPYPDEPVSGRSLLDGAYGSPVPERPHSNLLTDKFN